jgi:cytochrome c
MLFFLLGGVALENAAAGDRELGQYLSSECVTCHRNSGQNAQGIPKINGWPEDQFIAVMNAYKDKQRDNPVMQSVAGRLEANDIAALAAYFRTQK